MNGIGEELADACTGQFTKAPREISVAHGGALGRRRCYGYGARGGRSSDRPAADRIRQPGDIQLRSRPLSTMRCITVRRP